MTSTKHYLRIAGKSIVVILIAAMLFACKNDMKTIDMLTLAEDRPDETAREVEMTYSDSGRIMIRLISPALNHYLGDEPYLEFPEGLRLLFYDSAMRVQSELTANYGINWENKKMMEVKDDVVIQNYKTQETLNTEHVVWDQQTKKIYSDVFVKRTTPDGVLYGKGFDADESLRNWKLRDVSGEFMYEEEPAQDDST
ncbi:MAG: LPS export ABC transporter periplasmic protein LptC [Bacteroidales bacterium]|nr:LPS export ABC transporter periplasmic protein LptC [Bacteroidales bacterium]